MFGKKSLESKSWPAPPGTPQSSLRRLMMFRLLCKTGQEDLPSFVTAGTRWDDRYEAIFHFNFHMYIYGERKCICTLYKIQMGTQWDVSFIFWGDGNVQYPDRGWRLHRCVPLPKTHRAKPLRTGNFVVNKKYIKKSFKVTPFPLSLCLPAPNYPAGGTAVSSSVWSRHTWTKEIFRYNPFVHKFKKKSAMYTDLPLISSP